MKFYAKRFSIIIWLLLCVTQFVKICIMYYAGIESVKLTLLFSFIELIMFASYFLIKYKEKFMFEFMFLFTLFFYLYNHVYSIIYFFIIDISIFEEFTVYHIYDALVLSTITFSLLVQISFISSNIYYFQRKKRVIEYKNNWRIQNIKGFSKKNKYFIIVYIVFSLLAVYYSYTYFSLPPEIKNSRNQVLKIIWSGPGVYIKAILIGVSSFIFIHLITDLNSKNIKRIANSLLLSLPVVLFWIAHFGAGNRREFISVFIFIFIFYILSKGIRLKKIIIIGVVFFAIMTLISTSRGGSEQNQKYLYLNSFGEFIYPYNTLIETMRMDMDFEDLKLGKTYIYPLYAFIPRSIWEDKPITIAAEFSWNMNKGFGLGFNPLTEAFMNWGKFSAFMLPLLILFIYIVFIKLDTKIPFLYIYLLMNVLNLNRGELGTVLIEMFLMHFSFYLLYSFSKSKIKPQ